MRKKVLFVILMLGISSSMFSQEKKKNAKVIINVDGVCMICKKRIEKAALSMKGVKYANWNVKTHDLSLIFDERKTELNLIKRKVAKVGHDTKEVKASQIDYDNLHPCCKYRDEDVKNDHKKRLKKNRA